MTGKTGQAAQGMAAGVYATLVTPLDERGGLAEAALEQLVGRLREKPLAGLGILGSTGECPSLGADLRGAVMARARQLAGALPIVCGVIDTVVERVREGIWQAADAGMDAVLLPPPFYYPLAEAALERFYTAMADASPVPLILYNIPQLTKINLPVGLVERLAAHPQVAGLKDSSGNLRYFQDCLEVTRGQAFLCLTGCDDLFLPSLTAGGAGLIGGSCNVAADAALAIWQEFAAGRLEEARRAQRHLTALVQEIDRLGGVPALKAALEATGIAPCRMAPPGLDLSTEQRVGLRAALARYAQAFPGH